MESQSGSLSKNQSTNKAEDHSTDAKSPEAKSPDANSTDEKSKDASSTGAKDKLKLCVTTSFLEDMAEVLGGDSVEISCIIPRGEDPHTYEAKPEDLKKLVVTQSLSLSFAPVELASLDFSSLDFVSGDFASGEFASVE